jgi:hypothetical protein
LSPFKTGLIGNQTTQAVGTRTVGASRVATSVKTGTSGSQTISVDSSTGLVSRPQTASPTDSAEISSSNGSVGGSGSPHSGLSQGAIVAIVVLATIVGMLSIFLGWIYYKKRSRKQQHAIQPA